MHSALGLVATLAIVSTACTSLPAVDTELRSTGLAGTELIYRFPVGRTYRAIYADETVSFVLLEPALDEPPSATFPYLLKEIRDDVFLVVWDSPVYHSTFIIDLERRELHASTLRNGETSFLGVAEIVEVRQGVDD